MHAARAYADRGKQQVHATQLPWVVMDNFCMVDVAHRLLIPLYQ